MREATTKEHAMKNDQILRELLNLLNSDAAHVTFDAAVKDLPANLRGKRVKHVEHSPWEILEHLRIAQWDILEYIRNPKHVSPDFPAGYWPKTEAPPSDKAWTESVAAFRSDLDAFTNLLSNPTTDVLAPIAHAGEKTILREVLLLADHNAYHLGQLVMLRRLLGAWH